MKRIVSVAMFAASLLAVSEGVRAQDLQQSDEFGSSRHLHGVRQRLGRPVEIAGRHPGVAAPSGRIHPHVLGWRLHPRRRRGWRRLGFLQWRREPDERLNRQQEVLDQAGLQYPGDLFPEDQRAAAGRSSNWAVHASLGSRVEAERDLASGHGTPYGLAGHRARRHDRPNSRFRSIVPHLDAELALWPRGSALLRGTTRSEAVKNSAPKPQSHAKAPSRKEDKRVLLCGLALWRDAFFLSRLLTLVAPTEPGPERAPRPSATNAKACQ